MISAEELLGLGAEVPPTPLESIEAHVKRAARRGANQTSLIVPGGLGPQELQEIRDELVRLGYRLLPSPGEELRISWHHQRGGFRELTDFGECLGLLGQSGEIRTGGLRVHQARHPFPALPLPEDSVLTEEGPYYCGARHFALQRNSDGDLDLFHLNRDHLRYDLRWISGVDPALVVITRGNSNLKSRFLGEGDLYWAGAALTREDQRNLLSDRTYEVRVGGRVVAYFDIQPRWVTVRYPSPVDPTPPAEPIEEPPETRSTVWELLDDTGSV